MPCTTHRYPFELCSASPAALSVHHHTFVMRDKALLYFTSLSSFIIVNNEGLVAGVANKDGKQGRQTRTHTHGRGGCAKRGHGLVRLVCQTTTRSVCQTRTWSVCQTATSSVCHRVVRLVCQTTTWSCETTREGRGLQKNAFSKKSGEEFFDYSNPLQQPNTAQCCNTADTGQNMATAPRKHQSCVPRVGD